MPTGTNKTIQFKLICTELRRGNVTLFLNLQVSYFEHELGLSLGPFPTTPSRKYFSSWITCECSCSQPHTLFHGGASSNTTARYLTVFWLFPSICLDIRALSWVPRPRIQTGSRCVAAGNDRGARSTCAWLSSLLPPELRGYQYRALCFTEELHFACELQSLRPLHKHFPLPVPHLAYLLANSYSSKNEVSVFLRILPWLPIPHLSMMVLSQGPLTFCTKTHKSHNMVCVSRLVCPTLFDPMDGTVAHTRLLCPWNSPDKNTRVGFHFLFQGIFPTQGSNPHLLHLLHWQAGSFTTVSCGEHDTVIVYLFPLNGRSSAVHLCYPGTPQLFNVHWKQNSVPHVLGFPGNEVVENPQASAEDAGDLGSIPRLGRFPGVGNGQPHQFPCLEYSSILPGKSHGQRSLGLQSIGLQRVRHDWAIELSFRALDWLKF